MTTGTKNPKTLAAQSAGGLGSADQERPSTASASSRSRGSARFVR
jgi:hypothetical protein